MVYLDPSMLITKNINDLFELPKGHIYAAKDSSYSCKKTGLVHCPRNADITGGTYFRDRMFV